MIKREPGRAEMIEAFIATYLKHHIIKAGLAFPYELISLTKFQRVAVAAPRFFGKSFNFSFFYPLYCLLEEEGTEVAIISATASLADEFLGKVRSELDSNQLIRNIFGDQRSKIWRTDRLDLKNGSQFRSFGAEKQLRGFHPKVIICDDLETAEMVVSKDRRGKFDTWFLTDLEGTMGPETQIIVIGTLLHPHSFLSDLVNLGNICGEKKAGWERRFYKSIIGPLDKRGKSLFPEKWPLEELLKKRLSIGPYSFEQEYQNNPVPDSSKKFKEEWFKYFKTRNPDWLYFTCVDPAVSLSSSADYTAIVTVGVDADFNIFVVDIIHERLLPKEVVNAMFSVYQRFRPVKMGIETVGFQKMLKHDFELQRRKRKLFPVIEELAPDGRRKELRIQALQPRFSDGTIFIKENQKDLVTELLMFPSPRCHDDIIDALAYTLDLIRPARRKRPDSPTEETVDMCIKRMKNSNAPVIWGNHNIINRY